MTAATGPSDSDAGGEVPRISAAGLPEPQTLSGRELEIFELLSRHRDAGRLYREALETLRDERKPLRVRTAAYHLRESITELERNAGLEQKQGLKGVIDRFRQAWTRATNPRGSGDPDLANILRCGDSFLDEVDDKFPSIKRRTRALVVGIDPGRRDGMREVEEARATRLLAITDQLNLIAHGNRVRSPVEFREELVGFEAFVLEWLQPEASADVAAVEKLRKTARPVGSERAREVGELIRRSPAAYSHFFDDLEDPEWLPVLAEAGFFTKPPEPVRGPEWVRFPGWPESRYLIRVAAKRPKEVFEIAMRIESDENVRVHEDLLDIAAQLPARPAATLARKESKWLAGYDGHTLALPQSVGPLLRHLAEAGQEKAAFELAGSALRLIPGSAQGGTRRRAVALFGEYSYEQILDEAWPAMEALNPPRALAFLCEHLVSYLGIASDDDRDASGFSLAWRPAIEDHGQNLGNSMLDTLVEAVRDRALALSSTPEGLALALGVLEKHPGPIFTRLTLYVLAAEGSAEQVGQALADPDLLLDDGVFHEYGELLRNRFADLPLETRDSVLALIAAGRGKKLTERAREAGAGTDEISRRERYWQLERYVLISEDLEGAHQDAFDSLTKEFGLPEHPTFTSYVTSWSGPQSPYTLEELRELGPAEVVEKLGDWEGPSGRSEAPTPEGLGRILEQAVAETPADYAAEAERFRGLDPTYARSLLTGLESALKEEKKFSWPPVLGLAEWVAGQPRAAGDQQDDHERDPHWGWARKQIMSLLSAGFGDRANSLPIELRERAWKLITIVAADPDPTREHEERYGGENMDPGTLSINTTRGQAMHTAVRYALWVERSVAAESEFDDLGELPEFKALLEDHLDSERDPSQAIRSVYGQWFPQLVRMDAAWAREIADRVFPSDGSDDTLFDAAWDTYVVFNTAYLDVFKVIEDAYAYAIERMNEGTHRAALTGNPTESLGGHLILLCIRHGVALDLFEAFWGDSAPETKEEVIRHTGWGLSKTMELDAETNRRIADIWALILVSAETQKDPSPLAGFGAWLGAGALDDAWLLNQALAVLSHDVYLEPDFVVYAGIARLAKSDATGAVKALRGMVENDLEGWKLHGSTAEARETLAAALADGGRATQSAARKLIDILVARGMTEFRELLLPTDPDD